MTKRKAFLSIIIIGALSGVMVLAALMGMTAGRDISDSIIDTQRPLGTRAVGRQEHVVNTMIFARFYGENEWVCDDVLALYERKYNTSEISVRNYWQTVSFGQMDFETRFVTFDGGSLEISRPRSFFQPRFPDTGPINPNGYDNRDFGGLTHVDEFYRRQSLLLEIFEAAKDQIDVQGINNASFGGSDRYINSVTFVFGGWPDDWGDLLWPHQFSVFFGDDHFVDNYLPTRMHIPSNFWDNNDRDVFTDSGRERAQLPSALPFGSRTVELDRYMMMFHDLSFSIGRDIGHVVDFGGHDLGHLGVSVHESAHILGLPDLYNYSDQNNQPMGRWCVMDHAVAMPVELGAYFRHRMGWIDNSNMPWIRQSGDFEMVALGLADSDDVIGFRIQSPVSSSEYFVVEYRSFDGLFDGGFWHLRAPGAPLQRALPGQGLIVYRVDTGVPFAQGNMFGPPNFMEVVSGGGNINNAYIDGRTRTGVGSGHAVFGGNTNLNMQGSTNSRLNGWNSQIIIYNVRRHPGSGTITFSVNIPSEVFMPTNDFPLLCGGLISVDNSRWLLVLLPIALVSGGLIIKRKS